MNEFVFDACSLIYLTKIEIKERLPLLGSVFVSPTVKEELIADLEKFPDARTLNENIRKKIIKVANLESKDLATSVSLGEGEKETIELCKKRGYVPVTDDLPAINQAISNGLKPKTSESILLELLKATIITYNEFIELFRKLAIIKSLNANIVEFFTEKAKDITDQKIENNKEGRKG